MIKTYDAKDVTVTFGNVYITGFSEDMVNCAKDEEMFSTSVGAQGDVVVNTTNNPLGTITITLQATSPQNEYLHDCARDGVMAECHVTNKNLGERVGGSQARVKTFPEREYFGEVGDRSYEIQVFDYDEENV